MDMAVFICGFGVCSHDGSTICANTVAGVHCHCTPLVHAWVKPYNAAVIATYHRVFLKRKGAVATEVRDDCATHHHSWNHYCGMEKGGCKVPLPLL